MTVTETDLIVNTFGNKLRVRVCGICVQNDKLLLIKHQGLGKSGYLWSPPGGGLDFSESASDCLLREFKEETGLVVKVGDFLFVHEFLSPPLHAIELFFEVQIQSGKLLKGTDPELGEQDQIIDEVAFLSWPAIQKEKKSQLHKALHFASDLSALRAMRGFFK